MKPIRILAGALFSAALAALGLAGGWFARSQTLAPAAEAAADAAADAPG